MRAKGIISAKRHKDRQVVWSRRHCVARCQSCNSVNFAKEEEFVGDDERTLPRPSASPEQLSPRGRGSASHEASCISSVVRRSMWPIYARPKDLTNMLAIGPANAKRKHADQHRTVR